MLAMILAVYVDGNQRIVHVSELISDNEDFITSGEYDNSHICCVYGNCSCNSLDRALANLNSNVLINITTDVTLSSLVRTSDLENVSIIGHNNPTVNCKHVGGIHFTFCHNCIIQGITWDGCGMENLGNHITPGLKLSCSSNVTIQNCSFQHSIGQAVVLSEVSGNVNINDCKFINNSHYRDHGAAIHYSSNNTRNSSQFVFIISNCYFSYNKIKSLLYLENRLLINKCNKIIFSNSTFCSNQGISVYAINHNIYLNEKVLFQNNTADNGTGIYISDHSTVIFCKNSDVMFNQNSADHRGGAIFLRNHSICLFDQNSIVTFNDNKATNGTIYSEASSNMIFKGICNFNSNSATQYGTAIYSFDNSHIKFTNNAKVTFNSNFVDHNGSSLLVGGTVYCATNCIISFEGNSTTVFTNNTADYGGAVLSDDNSIICFEGNSTTIFSNNNAYAGGAIQNNNVSYISFKENSTTLFSNNTATNGGAILCFDHGHVSFENNSTTAFSNNTAVAYGGAAILALVHCDITFDDNSTASFNSNIATISATVYSAVNSILTTKGCSSIVFNDISAKWCHNSCLPYTDHNDVVTIDGNGIVWCSDRNAFFCLSNKCYCKNLEDILVLQPHDEYISVNISENVLLLSSTIHLLVDAEHITIVGHNNPTVICVNVGRIEVESSFNGELIIEGITWIGCGVVTKSIGVLSITKYSKVTIEKCSFQYSVGPVITMIGATGDVNIIDCKFVFTSHFSGEGAAIAVYSLFNAEMLNMFTIKNCYFHSNKGSKSVIAITYADNGVKPYNYNYYYAFINIINSIFHNNEGTSIHLWGYNFILYINGEVLFENNVAENGAGIDISDHSTVIFGENSNATFINNTVNQNGAAMFLNDYSSVLFDNNSTVTFTDNKATNGIIYSMDNSNVIFKGTCQVTFSSNSATQYGSAIYSSHNSRVTFTGNATVNFNNNVISSNIYAKVGGTIFSENVGYISFKENSVTVFQDNLANFGTAIFSIYNSNVIFKDRSRVIFNNNTVRYCGILTSALFSNVTFTDNTNVTYDTNTVSHTLPTNYESSAGAICTFQNCKIALLKHSLVTFINNRADRGGAVIIFESNVFIEGYSVVKFENNFAWYSSGGAFTCYNNSNVTIAGNSNVTFNGNKASQDGGAIYSYNMCKITFKDNSISTFINNIARNNGGAILSSKTSKIMFDGNSTVIFNDSMADNGGALYFDNGSDVIFSEFTNVEFNHNRAFYGGAILANDHCNITLTGNSDVLFAHNEATQSGGAGYFNYSCNFIMQENASATFDNNRALHGGAVCIRNKTELTFKGNSTAIFCNNVATIGGGATEVLNDSSVVLKDLTTIKFIENNAQYGGAIFLDATAIMVNSSDKTCIKLKNNIAKVLGNSLYQDVTEFCNNNCIINRMVGIRMEYIATPPNQLKFYDPAVCIDNDNETQCNNYYIQNIMLGTEIIIPACVLDYYNHSVGSTQFLVHSEIHPNYINNGLKEVLISCDKFEGVNIIGNQTLSKSTNFSINITLNVALNSDWKQISVNLIIELSPCHPGFWQYPNSKTCECYNADDIVFCSGSSSTIKRGYWFGSVTGKPTVTFCPINYCDFTCCESSNGYYHLSPVRNNQCRSHRSGTACGSCEEGYTLSFDSPECIHVNECSIGQTILLLTLILLYWVIIIAAVFSMMHFKIGIGYLYAITFYYSMVDLLLNQNWYLSYALNTTINVMSSIAKIIPQFLGQFCFIKNMSGIDQQFIHYIHPVAISLFLVMITVLSRRSRRLSSFISKGIIHVICCLLLLSYTSLATTSLMLMRPLIFHDVDEVYTYVSPDIEYFHGRHLAYAIVALLITIVIVIGLPLLLALEPFLNSKINFVKIKPLLDQFQGCYKDRYRYFASYYMICRLVVITIIIANSSNHFIFEYLLIIACVIVALVHQSLRPYSSSLLNVFDGVILHFLVLVSVSPLVESFDSFNSNFIVGITFVLVVLPVLIFVTMSLMINKEKIKKLPGYCYTKCLQLHLRNYNEIPLNEREKSPDEDEHVNVIDDSRRINATICDV